VDAQPQNVLKDLASDREGMQIDERLTFLNEMQLPAVITAIHGEPLVELLAARREPLAAILRHYGAILFRGFGLRTAEEFQAAAAECFGDVLRPYVGGISPRAKVTAGVYESTRFPNYLRIPQHNEMSYLPDSPRTLAFFCEVAPGNGGETTLADSRIVYERIPADIRERFEQAGIRYSRYLYGPRWNPLNRLFNLISELHTSWMEAFATGDRAVVERVCADQGGSVHWDWEQGARITNDLPPARLHPQTGEKVWFNQAASFLATPQSTGLPRWLLYTAAHPFPHRRPFHATLANGDPISHSQVSRINAAIESATVRFPWQRGDFLLVDNYLVSHGRMPFKGDRRILVAMR
jgi:alpha-ketoglutarate-dependent taurine dioxygenase